MGFQGVIGARGMGSVEAVCSVTFEATALYVPDINPISGENLETMRGLWDAPENLATFKPS
jgi:hypothetical protein